LKYDIPYEHIKDELITSVDAEWHFNNVKNKANKNKLELSDDDFMRFFKLDVKGQDIDWIMHNMSAYKKDLIDALINYTAY